MIATQILRVITCIYVELSQRVMSLSLSMVEAASHWSIQQIKRSINTKTHIAACFTYSTFFASCLAQLQTLAFSTSHE